VPFVSQQPSGHVVALHAGAKEQYDPGWLHLRPEAAQLLQAPPPEPHR
jgi:hypothetical protein